MRVDKKQHTVAGGGKQRPQERAVARAGPGVSDAADR